MKLNLQHIRSILFLICFFTFYFLIFNLFISPAFAINEGRLGAFPTNYNPENPKTRSWFIYELPPGEANDDSITVVNNTDETINVKVYPVDATTTNDGAFALLNEDQVQTGVGSWVTMSKDTISIEARGKQEVPFTITIPKNTTVGDHPGGIIVQEVTKTNSTKEGIGLNIVSRVGTRIYETVPGDKVFKMDLRDLTYKLNGDHLEYSFTLENTGNVILNPTGRVELKDQSGKIIDTIHLNNLGSVFPRKPTVNTAKSENERPMFGQFTATVIISYTTTKAVSESIHFFLYLKNWEYFIPIPILILLTSLLIPYLRRHAHHYRRLQGRLRPQPVAPVPSSTPALPRLPASPAIALAETGPRPANIDQLFIARHIKLIIFLIPSSIVLLSCFFAVMLYLFAVSRTGVTNYATTMIAPAINQIIQSPSPIPSTTQPTSHPAGNQQSTPSTTPTPQAIDKSDIQIEVLNGSGIAGAAMKVADKLTANGYTVTKIDNSFENVVQTIIRYPKGKLDNVDQLEAELKPDFTNIKLEESTSSTQYTLILVN